MTVVLRDAVLEVLEAHVRRTSLLLDEIHPELPRLSRWAVTIADRLRDGARLLVAGNGGSAAQAGHLAAELVGRYRDDRAPFSAIVLGQHGAVVTALVNDYDPDLLFAREVEAHGRAGDVLVLLSTSGRSANVVAAAEVARRDGITVFAVTGATPNPLAAVADDVVAVPSVDTPSIQDVHQVIVHLLCDAMEVSFTCG